jgi:hypothetical protein
MQKTNTKASILIWAIFLSMIISISFISINTKVKQSLENNYKIINKFKIDNEIINIINSWSINNTFLDEYNLENNQKLIFDKNDESIIWLKKYEIHISKIIENSEISIEILEWGPIKWNNTTNNGIINTTDTLNLINWDLEIKNLAWYSKIKIISNSDKNYLTQYRNYKIIQQIWNKQVIKSKWQIKNF